MPLNGYDIAGVNGSGIITTALTGAFVICKASEGQSFTDPLHDSFVTQLRSKGKLVGHYHYGRPDTKSINDAVKEADHFIATAKAKPGETMWLDFEKSEDVSLRDDWPEWVIGFCNRVKEQTGASCGIYLNNWFMTTILAQASPAQQAAIRAIPLWKAAWPADPATGPGSLQGWPVLTMWQWTDKQGTLGIDRDIFYGDASTWRALGVGAPTTPTTPPEEDMPLTDDDIRRVWAYKNPDPDVSQGKDAYAWLREGSQPVDLKALAAEIVAALPDQTSATAADIADEFAKRLET